MNDTLERGRKIADKIGLKRYSNGMYDTYDADDIHRLLGEGAEVLGHKKTEFGGWGFDQSGIIPGVTTHTALLIAIRPIAQESEERKMLRRLVNAFKINPTQYKMQDIAIEAAEELLAKEQK